eukprot:1690374-Amphidinium_carterae.2
MVGKIAKSSWWPGGPWAHGELLPMPWPIEQSLRKRRVAELVWVINRLAAASARDDGLLCRNSPPRGHSPTSCQSKSLAWLEQLVELFGECPHDLDPASALAEIVGSQCLYSEVPANLAEFDLGKLKIAKAEVCAKPVDGL